MWGLSQSTFGPNWWDSLRPMWALPRPIRPSRGQWTIWRNWQQATWKSVMTLQSSTRATDTYAPNHSRSSAIGNCIEQNRSDGREYTNNGECDSKNLISLLICYQKSQKRPYLERSESSLELLLVTQLREQLLVCKRSCICRLFMGHNGWKQKEKGAARLLGTVIF